MEDYITKLVNNVNVQQTNFSQDIAAFSATILNILI